jgi:hypothetical protein
VLNDDAGTDTADDSASGSALISSLDFFVT